MHVCIILLYNVQVPMFYREWLFVIFPGKAFDLHKLGNIMYNTIICLLLYCYHMFVIDAEVFIYSNCYVWFSLPLSCSIFCRKLSDLNRDGQLNLEEFIIAMKLVMMRRNNHKIPSVLPDSLKPKPLGNRCPPLVDVSCNCIHVCICSLYTVHYVLKPQR